jgi:hypothetical protein
MTNRTRIGRIAVTALLSAGLLAGSAAGPAPAAVSHIPDSATTAPKSMTRNPEHPPIVITSRAGRHSGYDRFVIEMRGKAPGYRIRYVTTPRYDGSGNRIPIHGTAYLLIVLTPANAHNSAGTVTYTGPRLSTVGLPTIKSFALAGDFEAHVSFALALRKKARFHVGELRNPRRLYVDVAH